MIASSYYVGNVLDNTKWDGVFSDQYIWNITVTWQGAGMPDPNCESWAVRNFFNTISKRLDEIHEPQPSSRTKAYFKRCRMNLNEAESVAWRFINKTKKVLIADLDKRHGSPEEFNKRWKEPTHE